MMDRMILDQHIISKVVQRRSIALMLKINNLVDQGAVPNNGLVTQAGILEFAGFSLVPVWLCNMLSNFPQEICLSSMVMLNI